MPAALMIDFGSTYTKTVAVDLDTGTLLGTSQSPTTVRENIMIGLDAAMELLYQKTGKIDFDHKLACSSAAGGLRMVAIGFVRELTAEASKRAALGAGAKVIDVFSYGLGPDDLARLKSIDPDVILLAGGTDGGNQTVLLENAQLLAEAGLRAPVVVAGNKKAAHKAAKILSDAGIEAILTENVLPQVDVLNVEPARHAIQEVFMQRIVLAKGLDRAQSFVQRILMPTPMAVLNAAQLLAEGTDDQAGLGELVIVDVGGATTDVHSVAKMITGGNTVIKGLPEPYCKRTVEGDLGIRFNAISIVEMAGEKKVLANAGLENGVVDLAAFARQLGTATEKIAQSAQEAKIDLGLARTATEIAIARHAGTVEEVHYVDGKVRQQIGKDLSEVKALIGTGGVFAYGAHGVEVLASALYDPDQPQSMRPRTPSMYIDSHYCLFAVGLLAEVAPAAALRMGLQNLLRAQ